jgi:hypothetical protein
MTVVDGIHGTTCNAQQYQQSLSTLDDPTPSITCLTKGQAIGLAVSIRPRLSSFCAHHVQLSTAVAFLSLASLFSVFIWIGVSLSPPESPLRVSVRSDQTLHSAITYGTGKMSRGVTGGCLIGLLTSIWSVYWLSAESELYLF